MKKHRLFLVTEQSPRLFNSATRTSTDHRSNAVIFAIFRTQRYHTRVACLYLHGGNGRVDEPARIPALKHTTKAMARIQQRHARIQQRWRTYSSDGAPTTAIRTHTRAARTHTTAIRTHTTARACIQQRCGRIQQGKCAYTTIPPLPPPPQPQPRRQHINQPTDERTDSWRTINRPTDRVTAPPHSPSTSRPVCSKCCPPPAQRLNCLRPATS